MDAEFNNKERNKIKDIINFHPTSPLKIWKIIINQAADDF